MATDDDDDLKVKQLLDPATEADLARWFSLPSFQQLAEQSTPIGPVIDEASLKKIHERRPETSPKTSPKRRASK